MSNDDRDVDILLRQNVQRHLEGFDWDRQRQTVAQRLAGTRIRKPRRGIPIGVAAGVAALLMLAVGYMSMRLLQDAGSNTPTPMEATASRASAGSSPLLPSTDPTTILLTGSARLLVLNDPMLAPHSLWDQ